MAIDTRFKRFNVMAMANGTVLHQPIFEADSSVDADDRAHNLGRYGGNAWASPGGATFMPIRRMPRGVRRSNLGAVA